MSDEIGMVSVLPGPADDAVFFPGTAGGPSEATRELVDEEVRKIVEDSYRIALQKLRENRGRLENLARELLEQETLDEDDAYRAAGFERKPPTAEVGGTPDLDGVQTADVTPADA
jgi:cell division protease FtsH